MLHAQQIQAGDHVTRIFDYGFSGPHLALHDQPRTNNTGTDLREIRNGFLLCQHRLLVDHVAGQALLHHERPISCAAVVVRVPRRVDVVSGDDDFVFAEQTETHVHIQLSSPDEATLLVARSRVVNPLDRKKRAHIDDRDGNVASAATEGNALRTATMTGRGSRRGYIPSP